MNCTPQNLILTSLLSINTNRTVTSKSYHGWSTVRRSVARPFCANVSRRLKSSRLGVHYLSLRKCWTGRRRHSFYGCHRRHDRPGGYVSIDIQFSCLQRVFQLFWNAQVAENFNIVNSKCWLNVSWQTAGNIAKLLVVRQRPLDS